MDGNDRYMSFWPLPGGWESYLETLSLILSKIRESRPTLDELANWAGNRFGSKPEWTRESLRICILYTSLARMEGNSLYLTEEGRRFLEAKDGEIVLNCLCRNIWGIREMLLWLMERPMTSRELFEKFKELGARWKKDYQVGYRLLWLRALGVIDEEGGRYSLTDYGIKFVKDLERIERKPPSSIEIYVKSVNEQIGRYPVDFWTEDNTKAVLVEPLMEVLGWNIRDLGEVIRGYGVRVGTKTEYVDYILKIDGRPKIFVEVKALGKDLEPFVDQAISYAKLGDVTWAVLTNGRELRVYDARSRFQLFKLTLDEYLKEIGKLLLLSKESVKSGLLDKYGDKEYHRQEIVKWFRRSADMIIEEIVKSNRNLRKDLVREVVEEMLEEMED